ncbi:alpha/beta hydrolase family protein, partial [Streptomyces sp. NPDC059786]|uniref:alpha/beta hydrolase family protein n=1 Tax=Streptomyces sp. NPDC059786 TaxID=3346946 RepID=UPI003663892C
PEHSYPAPVEDVIAAGAHLRSAADRFGVDPEAVGVRGSSAGASLATPAALRRPDLFKAFVHYCGPTDLYASASRSPMEAFLLGDPIETAYLGGPGGDCPERAAAASPLRHAGQGARPSLIVHGDRDRITGLADAEAPHQRLSRAGSESTLMTVAGAGHDDPRFDQPFVRAATAAFLADALG